MLYIIGCKVFGDYRTEMNYCRVCVVLCVGYGGIGCICLVCSGILREFVGVSEVGFGKFGWRRGVYIMLTVGVKWLSGRVCELCESFWVEVWVLGCFVCEVCEFGTGGGRVGTGIGWYGGVGWWGFLEWQNVKRCKLGFLEDWEDLGCFGKVWEGVSGVVLQWVFVFSRRNSPTIGT